MARTVLALGLAAFLTIGTGCQMGAHPYDYCGPVWSSGPCKNCNPNYRAGSILSGGATGRMPEPTVQTTAPMPNQAVVPEPALEPPPSDQTTPSAEPRSGEQAPPAKTTGVTDKKFPPAPTGMREGATKTLSVEDRKVESPGPKTADGEASPAAEQPKSDSTSGWVPKGTL